MKKSLLMIIILILMISLMICLTRKEDVYAESNTPGSSVSGNSFDQKDPVQIDQEALNEAMEKYFSDIEASDQDDGQLVYLVCELYDNMEVMTSGILKLLTVQIVMLAVLTGAVVAQGILDHFIR